MITKELKSKALQLKDVDKVHLVELILDSIDRPDPEIEKEWVKESEKRYAAYKKGKIKAIPYSKIIKKYSK
ncbi:MAG: addiction module protein [Planctomycetota bacterium]|jgi:putative addiction module component (TIGR02574 family)